MLHLFCLSVNLGTGVCACENIHMMRIYGKCKREFAKELFTEHRIIMEMPNESISSIYIHNI